jgi:transposase
MQADWTKVLGWPGYRVYDYRIDEARRQLTLRVRRKRGNRKLTCAQCGRRVHDIRAVYERQVRDLPCFEFQTAVVVELYRIRCPDCGVKAERSEQVPSKAPYSKRFEDAVGQACEGAAARQVARRMRLAESTVRAIDLRYLERWEARRRKPPLRQMGVDEIYKGKRGKFLTVVCNLETAEPLWFGRDRKRETLDEFFRHQLRSRQRKAIEAACVDMWEPFRLSIEHWAPQCRIVYDKFHIMQHANAAIDEVRKAEFFRQGKLKRRLIKGKKWLLLSRWKNLTETHRGDLNELFQMNRRVFKAYLLKESLDRFVELPLPRGHDQLPAAVDGSTEMAAAPALRETCRHTIEAPGRHRELLPDQGPDGCGGSRQWQHPDAHQSRARLHQPALPAAQGQATGGKQPRTPRCTQNRESRVIRPLCQILAQSGNV